MSTQKISRSSIRKDEILKAAARLFRKKGYRATSVRMIATEMKMEAASLYNHIASKQEILRELLMDVARRFTRGMEEVEVSGLDPFGKLELLVGLHVRVTLELPDPIALITGEWVHLEEPFLQDFLNLRTEYETRFKAILREGIQTGMLAPVNVDMALFSILSSLHWLYSWSGRHPEVKAEELENEIRQCLLLGLKKRESLP